MHDANKNSKRSQKTQPKIKVNSPDSPYPSAETEQKRLQPRRLSSYFLVFIDKGSVTYQLDLQDMHVHEGAILFAMPNQIFVPPAKTDGLSYFKVLFDDTTLALLPQRFSFLVNPLNAQIIALDNAVRERVRTVFEMLHQLQHPREHTADPEILLAYLNLLLSELNNAYFKNERVDVVNPNVSKFVAFKIIVETQLTGQPSIPAIAEKLALTTNSLYRLVKIIPARRPRILSRTA